MLDMDQVTFGLLLGVTVAWNCWLWPSVRVTGVGLTETVIAVVGSVTVTAADPVMVECAVEIAVIVTVAGDGTSRGAV